MVNLKIFVKNFKFCKKLNKESYLAILRLTKNISCDTRPFDQWIKSYKNDQEIYAFDDLILSPITYEASAEVVLQILKKSNWNITFQW